MRGGHGAQSSSSNPSSVNIEHHNRFIQNLARGIWNGGFYGTAEIGLNSLPVGSQSGPSAAVQVPYLSFTAMEGGVAFGGSLGGHVFPATAQFDGTDELVCRLD